MKKAALPRFFAAVTSVVVTIVLLDLVATMGQSPDSNAVDSAAERPAVYHVAVSTR